MRWKIVLISAAVSAALLIVVILMGKKKSDSRSSRDISHKIRVEVLNGCGEGGLARHTADFLRREGFDVVNGNGGNAECFSFVESIVVDRVGDMSKAEKVADVLDIENCIRQVNMDPYRIEEVTVIIGGNYRDLKPFVEEVP